MYTLKLGHPTSLFCLVTVWYLQQFGTSTVKESIEDAKSNVSNLIQSKKFHFSVDHNDI